MSEVNKSFLIICLAICLGLFAGPSRRVDCAAPNLRKTACSGNDYSLTRHLRHAVASSPANQPELPRDLVVVQASEIRPSPLTSRFPQGSQLARLAMGTANPSSLTPGFFAAADPRVSFDGTRVLFAGKKDADSFWQIWELRFDGTGARQVTHCKGDCVQPSYLPRGQTVYTAVQSVHPRAPGGTAVHISQAPPGMAAGAGNYSQIWVSNLDGTDAHPITFGPGDFQVETILTNGMILATARWPLVSTSGLPADRELYVLRPDGTGLATLRCDHQHPAIRSQAREMDDGAVVFVKTSLASHNPIGSLFWLRRGALQDAPLAASAVLASDPQPVGPGQLVVTLDPPRGSTMSGQPKLTFIDTATGAMRSALDEDPKLATVQAVPVASHEPPRWYWSTLNPALQRGYFVCLNSYLADGVPHGRITAKLKRVRILSLDNATQRESALGEAPVEEDGSFYVAVPPDKPVRFEVLDTAGRVLRAQRSWIWARSGEEHGCVGCHEDRAVAPENRWPMALRRFDTPIRLDLKASTPGGIASRQSQ